MTKDLDKRKLWLGSEFEPKVNEFRAYFGSTLPSILNKDRSILCVGARTGQEVVALKSLGYIQSIGVDIVPFKPNVIFGDMHDLPFTSSFFSLVFTNSFDHSIYPLKFLDEVNRVLIPGGIFLLHVLLNKPNDKFGVTDVYSLKKFRKILTGFSIIKERKINIFSMNYEFILRKN